MNTLPTDSDAAGATTAYRDCLAQAVARSTGVLEKLLAAARDSLYQRSRQLEPYQGRGTYTAALQTLSDNTGFMVQRFSIEFEEALRHGDGLVAKVRREPLELSLLDDAQLQGHVELTRSHQAAHHALEAPLAELDGLVSRAQGLSRIQPQRNPLRPEVYLRALQAMVDRTQVSPQVRALWMQHLTTALGAYLKTEYEHLSALLRKAGVVPAGYEAVAIARPGQKAAPAPGAAGPGVSAGGASAATGPTSLAVPPEQPSGAPVSEATARGVLRTEERRMLAARIAEEIARLPETARVPVVVRAFVLGPWPQVIAEAQLAARGAAADPEGYYALVRPLLWSAQPELGRADRQHLTSVLQNLFTRLRAGLASIAWPEDDTADFFQALVDAHQIALRPDGSSFTIRNRSAPAMPATEARAGGAADAPLARPWQAPADDLAFRTAGDGLPGSSAAAGDTLAPGVTIELLQDGQWRRLQLLWASPHGSLLLFEGEDGRNESMTRRLCVQWMKDNRLRIVPPG